MDGDSLVFLAFLYYAFHRELLNGILLLAKRNVAFFLLSGSGLILCQAPILPLFEKSLVGIYHPTRKHSLYAIRKPTIDTDGKDRNGVARPQGEEEF